MANVIDKKRIYILAVLIVIITSSIKIYGLEDDSRYSDEYLEKLIILKNISEKAHFFQEQAVLFHGKKYGCEVFTDIDTIKYRNKTIGFISEDLKNKYEFIGLSILSLPRKPKDTLGFLNEEFDFLYKINDSTALIMTGFLPYKHYLSADFDVAKKQLMEQNKYSITFYQIIVNRYFAETEAYRNKNRHIQIISDAEDAEYYKMLRRNFPEINKNIKKVIADYPPEKHRLNKYLISSGDFIRFMYHKYDLSLLEKSTNISNIPQAPEIPDERLWFLAVNDIGYSSYKEFNFSVSHEKSIGDIISTIESKYKLIAYDFPSRKKRLFWTVRGEREEFDLFFKKNDLTAIHIRGYLEKDNLLPKNKEKALEELKKQTKYNLSIYEVNLKRIDKRLLQFIDRDELSKMFPKVFDINYIGG